MLTVASHDVLYQAAHVSGLVETNMALEFGLDVLVIQVPGQVVLVLVTFAAHFASVLFGI